MTPDPWPPRFTDPQYKAITFLLLLNLSLSALILALLVALLARLT